MGLRTIYGIKSEDFTQITNGSSFEKSLIWNSVENMIQLGFLKYNAGILCTTQRGLAMLDYIVRSIY